MNLCAYFDESGTHEGSPVMVMAGFLGNRNQWARFRVDLDRLRSLHGFRVFHAKDFKAKAGEFRNWTDANRRSLVDALANTVATRLMEGATVSLEPSQYKAEYRSTTTPRWVRPDTAYGLCFRLCLGHMVLEVHRRLFHHKRFSQTRLRVVLERGHANQGDAARIFKEMKSMFEREGLQLLSDFSLATKEEEDPLMVADLLAFTRFAMGLPSEHDGSKTRPSRSGQNGAGLTHLYFGPDGMKKVKEANERLQGRIRSRRRHSAEAGG